MILSRRRRRRLASGTACQGRLASLGRRSEQHCQQPSRSKPIPSGGNEERPELVCRNPSIDATPDNVMVSSSLSLSALLRLTLVLVTTMGARGRGLSLRPVPDWDMRATLFRWQRSSPSSGAYESYFVWSRAHLDGACRERRTTICRTRVSPRPVCSGWGQLSAFPLVLAVCSRPARCNECRNPAVNCHLRTNFRLWMDVAEHLGPWLGCRFPHKFPTLD